jgi:chromosome segregation ATPase
MATAPEIPTNTEIAAEKDVVRRAILSAIQRILLGQPKSVPTGATSISHLALEANVGRHNLYQSHSDLRDRYEYLRDSAHKPTFQESRLQSELDAAKAEIKRLIELQSRTVRRAENWQALTETLERAVNVLQEEFRLEQLKSRRLRMKLEQSSDVEATVTKILIRKPNGLSAVPRATPE